MKILACVFASSILTASLAACQDNTIELQEQKLQQLEVRLATIEKARIASEKNREATLAKLKEAHEATADTILKAVKTVRNSGESLHYLQREKIERAINQAVRLEDIQLRDSVLTLLSPHWKDNARIMDLVRSWENMPKWSSETELEYSEIDRIDARRRHLDDSLRKAMDHILQESGRDHPSLRDLDNLRFKMEYDSRAIAKLIAQLQFHNSRRISSIDLFNGFADRVFELEDEVLALKEEVTVLKAANESTNDTTAMKSD